MLEAGTSLTPASWHGKSAGSQSRSSLPHTSVTSDTSDSDADSTFTAPSGRLNAAGAKSSPTVSNQTKPMFRVSPSSNRSPQTSFRLKNFTNKSSGRGLGQLEQPGRQLKPSRSPGGCPPTGVGLQADQLVSAKPRISGSPQTCKPDTLPTEGSTRSWCAFHNSL